ncbi:MAG: NAD(P)/FAD-dependent oxidoreductase [Saprospiraceae bacterium]|nr:NAD(P)/FAD-dependent oxidoreductase [Saprospiraceae bacterium]
MGVIKTDILIIGTGPVGLFAVFEAGLLKMRCHLIDVLPQIGGQLIEIYPKKPIYDIPGCPMILASDLVDNLKKQIEPFRPGFTLGEIAEKIDRLDDGSFRTTGHDGTIIESRVIAIAGGLGCFEPRKPPIDGIEKLEGKGVDYFVKNPIHYKDRRVVIAGGGDSALDWTIELSALGSHITLVHRRSSFRGAPDSVDKVLGLVSKGKVKLITDASVVEVKGSNGLQAVVIEVPEGKVTHETDFFIPLFGLTPKLGPIADWGLGLDKNAIVVDPYDCSTSVDGIFAIGDINTYPGKLKLILCGFHEATMMCQAAFRYMYPEQKLSFKYTTVTGIDGFTE